MNTGIKTCAKCGAKNFQEFTTCFHCGGSEFYVGQESAKAPEAINARAPVGLQHISVQVPAQPRPSRLVAPPSPQPAAGPAPVREDREVLERIVDKLNTLEHKLEATAPPAYEGGASRQGGGSAEPRYGGREAMELMAAQREQIAKLEAERAAYEEQLRVLSEEKGRNCEVLNYLDSEKKRLEQQLQQERERFSVMSIRQPNNAPPLPEECVIFTGEDVTPQQVEWARGQFLRVYPRLEGGEDVAYYIPGDRQSPPVVVLNPDSPRSSKRNLKINFLSPAMAAPQPQQQPARPEREERQAAINSEVVASPAIKDISEFGRKPPKQAKPQAERERGKGSIAVCLMIGILFLASLGLSYLPYMFEIKGYEVVAHSLGLVTKIENPLNLIIPTGQWAGMGKYVGLIAAIGGLTTLAGGILCLVRPSRQGGLRALRILFMVLTLLLDVLLFACVDLVYAGNIVKNTGVGLWVKMGVDLAVIALSFIFMHGEREEELKVRPLDIVDRTEAK